MNGNQIVAAVGMVLCFLLGLWAGYRNGYNRGFYEGEEAINKFNMQAEMTYQDMKRQGKL